MQKQTVMQAPRASIFKAFLVLMALVMASSAHAELRIGVLNMAKVLKEAPQMDQMKRQMDAEFGDRRDSIEAQLEVHKEEVQKFQRENTIMGEEERLQKQRTLRQRENTLKEQMLALNDDVSLKERELMRSFKGQLRDAVDQFAQANGFDFIVMKEAMAFSGPQYDVTDQFLATLR